MLTFWIARAAMRGINNKASRSAGVKKADVKPNPCHPLCIALMAVIAVISLIWMTVNGLNNGLLTFDIITMSALGLIGIFTAPGSKRASIKSLPDSPPAPPGAAQMRERAAELLSAPVADTEPQVTQNAPTALLERPRAMSYEQALAEREDDMRLLRVAAILLAPCPDCNALAADFCTYLPGAPVTLLDPGRKIAAHDHRIGHSVKLGISPITEIVAQYDGNPVPDGVWEASL